MSIFHGVCCLSVTTRRKFEQHSVLSVTHSFVCVWVASGCRVFVVGVKVALSCREQLGWIESRRGNG